MTFDPEAGTPMMHIPLIGSGKIAPGKGKIVDGIQQIGLAYAIITANPHYPFPELKGGLAVILELDERYIL